MSLFPDQRWLWDGIFLGTSIPKSGDFYPRRSGFFQTWGFLSLGFFGDGDEDFFREIGHPTKKPLNPDLMLWRGD